MKRAATGVAAGLAALLAVAGCGGGRHPRAAPPPPTTAAVPQRNTLDTGAAMNFALGPAPANWNPLSAGDGPAAGVVAAGILPSAFNVQPDLSLSLNNDLLVSAAMTSTDPPTVVYRINPKATWSDGVPITWKDFQYNWQAQSGQARFSDAGGRPFTPATTLGYRDIASVSATSGDPDEVTVVFSTLYPDWRALFATLVPAHVATRIGFDQGFTDPVDDVVSGGPFLVEQYRPGQSLTLVRNARWWGSPASLSSITFYFVANPAVATTALSRGEVEGTYLAPTATYLAAARATSGVKVDVAAGATWEELEFNQRNGWLKDQAVRQAAMLAVDRTRLIAGTVGAYAPNVSPLDNRVFIPEQPAYVDNSSGRYDQADTSGALSLLKQAGYTLSAGVLARNGQAVTLRIAASAGTLHSAEEAAVVKDLSAVGIRVQEVAGAPQPASPAGYDLAIVDRSASPAMAAANAAIGDPATVGTANYSGADLPSVDALLSQAGATTDQAARAQLYNKADAALWRDAESLPLFQLPTAVAFQQRYLGISASPAADGPAWDVASWGVPDQS